MVKRLLFSAVLALAMIASATAQTTVTIGTGTSSGRTTPFCSYYNNGTAAMIYNASNFEAACDIESIAFDCYTTIDLASSIHIYVGTKTGSTFANSSDWPALSDLTEVYADENAVLGTAEGWETYAFNAPYSYDPANGNLVVVVTRQSSSYSSSYAYNYTSTTDAVLVCQNDGDATVGDIESVLSMAGTKGNNLPNAQFVLTYTGAVCARPASAPVASDITTESANITWGAGEGASEYQVVVVAAGMTPDWSTAEIVGDVTFTASGLAANTKYDVYVRSYCDESTQSNALMGSFRTECEAIAALPWLEGFENETVDAKPSCWTSSSTSYPTVKANTSYSTYAHNGNNCLYTYGGSSYYGEQYFVFPSFGFDLNTAQLQLWHKENYSSSTYVAAEIGVMSDPNDGSTFVALATLEKATSYTYFDLNIVADAAHTYLAIHIPTGGYAMSYYFDDIALVEKPSCVHPENIAAGNETLNSIDITWESSAAADSVLVKNGDVVLYNDLVTGGSVTIDNLDAATLYTLTVAVKGICSATDESEAKTATLNVQTLCEAVSAFPWVETFEGGTSGATFAKACWSNEHISGSGVQLFQYASGGEEGNALKLPDMTATTYTLLTLPEFDIPGEGYEFSLSVNRDGNSASYYKAHEGVRVIYNNDNDTLFIPRYIQVEGGVGTVEATGWYNYSVSLPAGLNTIKILGVCEYGSATLLDNFRVGVPATCFKASDLKIVSGLTGSSSVTIAWTAPEEGASEYKVLVSAGDSIIVNNELTTDTFYIINGLTRNTAYSLNISIVTVCGPDSESDAFSGTKSVTTLPTCYPVSGLTASNITAEGAELNWTPSGHGEAQYQYCVVEDGAAADWTNGVFVVDETAQISGLNSNTAYRAYVRSYCGEDDESTAVYCTFTTAPSLPYLETFENGIPDNWSRSNTSRTSVFGGTTMGSTTSGWNIQSNSSYYPAGMDKNLKVNIYGAYCHYWALMPTLDLSAETGAVTLSFDAAWTAYNSPNAIGATTTTDLFMVAVSADGGATWSEENAWIWANDESAATMGVLNESFSNTVSEMTIDLTPYVGGTVTIGFYAESAVSGGDNDFHIDNVRVAAEDSPSTSIENNYELKAVKVIRNGQIMILRDGKLYDVTGKRM